MRKNKDGYVDKDGMCLEIFARSGLCDKDVISLSRQASVIYLFKNQSLADVIEDVESNVYCIYSGLLSVNIRDGEGRELYYLSKGSWFGEDWAMQQPSIPFRYIATRQCTLVALKTNEFRNLINNNAKFVRYMWEVSAIWSWRAIEMSIVLKHSEADFRIFFGLFNLAELINSSNQYQETSGLQCDSNSVDLPLTHAQLARYCRASRARTTSLLGQLRKEGLVDLSYGVVTILNLSAWRIVLHTWRNQDNPWYKLSGEELIKLLRISMLRQMNSDAVNWGYQPFSFSARFHQT